MQMRDDPVRLIVPDLILPPDSTTTSVQSLIVSVVQSLVRPFVVPRVISLSESECPCCRRRCCLMVGAE